MLKMNEAELQTRLESMKLKELCHLYEMSQLPGSFGGGEEVLPPPRYSIKNPNPQNRYHLYPTVSEKRVKLERMILEHLKETYRRTHEGEQMDGIWAYSQEDGFDGFMVIWDHWQVNLKEVVCKVYSRNPHLNKGYNWELWDDSSDEDV